MSPRKDGYLVAGIARGPPVSLVVALAGQEPVACPAGETVSVVLLPHRLHRWLPGSHHFVAEGTDVCRKKGEGLGAMCLSFPNWEQAHTAHLGPPPYLWSCPSPGIHLHPATVACPLAPGKIWAASIQRGGQKEPGKQGKQRHATFMLLQVGKLRHWGNCTPSSSPGGW